jgi:glutamine synthetase
VGHDVSVPSRNRTVLAGLVRDAASPMATRFEVRAPNPHTNTYLAVSAFFQAMVDGMTWAASSGKTAGEIEKDFDKAAGVPHPYLEKERAYRSEEDVFEHFTDADREKYFGKPPATVWETIENLGRYPEKLKVLSADGVFSAKILDSYRQATLTRWTMELVNRIIPENARFIRTCTRLEGENALDADRWARIHELAQELMRDDVGRLSVFTRIREAVERKDLKAASELQTSLAAKMKELVQLYQLYRRNLGFV